jgi:uracil-DNA glycosylase family 4
MIRAEEMLISEVSAWFFGIENKDASLFPQDFLGDIWQKAAQLSKVTSRCVVSHPPRHAKFVSILRAGLLHRLRAAVNACQACPLHENRLPGRGVLDDASFENDPFAALGEKPTLTGALGAKIMVVSEGPGQFESRTANVLVSYQILAGSCCARLCANYEGCYSEKSPLPQQPCKPRALSKDVTTDDDLHAVWQERATRRFEIHTAGEILDETLFKAGLWRESWNPRQLFREGDIPEKLKPRPGTVYLSNIIKCRATKPNPKKFEGVEDRAPTKEEAAACRRWLDLQRYIVQPAVLIALGKPAFDELTGEEHASILNYSSSRTGKVYESRFGIPLLVEPHPAFILRQEETAEAREWKKSLIETFIRAQEIASGEIEEQAEEEQEKGEEGEEGQEVETNDFFVEGSAQKEILEGMTPSPGATEETEENSLLGATFIPTFPPT